MDAPDDQPLNVTDLDERYGHAPLAVLAERVIAHLDGEWTSRPMAGSDALLEGPEGIRLLFATYGNGPYNAREFWVGTYTLTGRAASYSIPMHTFARPSHIAAELEAVVLPKVRKRLAAARRETGERQAQIAERKAFIDSIAKSLDWDSSSYQCHSHEVYRSLGPAIGRRRKSTDAPSLVGEIGYSKDGSMYAHLRGLTPDLIGSILAHLHYCRTRHKGTDDAAAQ